LHALREGGTEKKKAKYLYLLRKRKKKGNPRGGENGPIVFFPKKGETSPVSGGTNLGSRSPKAASLSREEKLKNFKKRKDVLRSGK